MSQKLSQKNVTKCHNVTRKSLRTHTNNGYLQTKYLVISFHELINET